MTTLVLLPSIDDFSVKALALLNDAYSLNDFFENLSAYKHPFFSMRNVLLGLFRQ